jgi:two-component system chemotaxis response regulator CheV
MAGVIDGIDQRTRMVGRNRMEMLMFRLGPRQRFGINVFKVREVIRCPPLTSLPHAHASVRGVASIRGVTIPVMDLGAAVGMAPIAEPREKFVIVAEYSRATLGFLVEQIERIVNLRWEEVKAAPRGIGPQNYLTAVTMVDDEMVEVIDVERVLADVMGRRTDTVDLGLVADSTLTGRHVLIADDSALARRQIQRVLEQLQCTYTAVQNGREAYEALSNMIQSDERPVRERVALVIADVEMPEMDGYTLTRRIREHPQMRDLFVCLHTSLSGNFNHAMATKVGADALLSKFEADELARVISEHGVRAEARATNAA